MKCSGYNWIFWGTLLVIFNIKLGELVIFPDIVGYVVIAIGVGYIVEKNDSQSARLAKLMTGAMVIGEGIRWVLLGSYYDSDILWLGVGLVLGIITLVMRYSLLEVEKESLEDAAEKQVWGEKQRAYLILHALALVGTSFGLNFLFLRGATSILNLVKEIYWLSLVYQLRKKYVSGIENVSHEN